MWGPSSVVAVPNDGTHRSHVDVARHSETKLEAAKTAIAPPDGGIPGVRQVTIRFPALSNFTNKGDFPASPVFGPLSQRVGVVWPSTVLAESKTRIELSAMLATYKRSLAESSMTP